jgi:S-methylmethionine-dependent homocysteine/selenocysteine methylase
MQLGAGVRVLDGGTGHELKRRGFGKETFAHSFMAGALANLRAPRLVEAVEPTAL